MKQLKEVLLFATKTWHKRAVTHAVSDGDAVFSMSMKERILLLFLKIDETVATRIRK